MKQVILLVAGLGLGVAGCGSSSNPTSTSLAGAPSGSKAATMVAFAQCMRSHGVPNFPDPGSGLRIQQTGGSVSVNGVQLNGPAFNSAQQACHSYLPNGGRPPQLNASQRQSALKFAQCMRSHGMTNFPDPNFGAGGVEIHIDAQSGLNPKSPAFKAAQQACGSFLPKGGPGGGP
jgi:hypothetical protein